MCPVLWRVQIVWYWQQITYEDAFLYSWLLSICITCSLYDQYAIRHISKKYLLFAAIWVIQRVPVVIEARFAVECVGKDICGELVCGQVKRGESSNEKEGFHVN